MVAGPFANVAVLLAALGSVVVDDTVTVFVEPWKFEGTLNVAWMVTVWLGFSVPKLQGNAVVQPPVLETNVKNGGVGSFTVTAAA